MLKRRKIVVPVLLAATLLFAAPTIAEQLKPSGTVSIDETQFGFLVGGSTGGGKLTFNGETHDFKIGGLSVGNIGVSKMKATGEVYNLTDIAKFPGTYSTIDASATVIKGAGGLRLKNKHGVILRLDTQSGGAQLSAGAGGVKVTMK